MNDKCDDHVKVSVRIKPTIASSSCVEVISKDPPVLVLEKGQTFHFDNIFCEDSSQQDIYSQTVEPLVQYVKNGYNCTVFAYGQTGTGKTYTMGTNLNVYGEENVGIISRTLEDFFQTDHSISVSFIEIYKEKVFDLLCDEVKMKPLVTKGFTAPGSEVPVSCHYDAQLLLEQGGKNRHTAKTKQNSNSSRSHAIFTIYCRFKNNEGETIAQLNLVDLAGSENVRKTGNEGNSFREGVKINSGLLSLGQVINALSTNSAHVPYRQSTITTILHDSLNKKNYISLLACVSSNVEDAAETFQTLRFASRVKRMKNNPEVVKVVNEFKKENPTIFQVRGVTPMKRSYLSNSYETPFKRSAPSLFPPISDECENLSIASTSVSSFTTQNNQQNDSSPVTKNDLNQIEKSIMTLSSMVSRFEEIQNTMIRPRRSRRLTEQNKENETAYTPTFSWDKLSRFFKKELQSLTVKLPTSSPIQDNSGFNDSQATMKRVSLPRKVLQYERNDSTKKQLEFTDDEDNILSTTDDKSENEERSESVQTFKIPNTPPLKPNIKADTVKTQKLRRSTRLSTAKVDDSFIWDTNRKSFSLKQKKSFEYNPRITTLKNTKTIKDSPVTARTKYVMKIINSGNQKDIERLHTVGKKTAEKIVIFRQVSGNIQKISDLSQIFTKTKYKKFLTENFLRDDS